MSTKKIITRTILIVSLVSLFTDISSEMLYPIMPVYLKSIGFTVGMIGLLEGLALFTAGASKGYFGKLSDATGKRMPFVRLGYFLSAIAKPLMGLFTHPVWIFLARMSDRLGKGVRSNARDAILSAETTAANKAKVFGFHQSFDTIGAAIGPICALIYLYYYPGSYRTMFLIAFAPAMVGVGFTFLVKDRKAKPVEQKHKPGIFAFLKYWADASPDYKKLVPALLIFALMNSSDTFLLLMMKNQGLSDTQLILVYCFYNIIFAALAYPAGYMADKFGLKGTFLVGCLLFSLVYLAFPYAHGIWFFGALFLAYGAYAAATDGIARAWITNLSPPHQTATALGFYTSLASIGTMFASFLGGFLWDAISPAATFIVPGAGVGLVALYLLFVKIRNSD